MDFTPLSNLDMSYRKSMYDDDDVDLPSLNEITRMHKPDFRRFVDEMIEVLKVPTMSGQEQLVAQYLLSKIPELQKDEDGNLFLFKKNTPLVCAHMDSVGNIRDQARLHSINFTPLVGIVCGNGNIGADDKVGVFIAMKLYEKFKDKISLLFCVEEETGMIGSSRAIKTHEKALKSCRYYIVPDRKGAHDYITGTANKYGCLDFEEKAFAIMEGLFFFPPP